MKKIMVLGSGGMLGHMVYNYLIETKKFKIIDSSFPTKAHDNSFLLDVTNKLEVEAFIKKERPDFLINCIGILIRASQLDPANSIYLNSFFPHQLAKILRGIDGKLIHISTDCVFSGIKGEYSENEFRDADDIYGRSKALGEISNEVDITLRTSIIGPEIAENGDGLFHWLLNQDGEINGYTKEFWGGVTTLQLAKVILLAIENNWTGLVNITNQCKISKYELISLIKQIWNLEHISIKPFEKFRKDKSLICSRKDLNINIPTYREMLISQLKYMENHKSLYKHYYPMKNYDE